MTIAGIESKSRLRHALARWYAENKRLLPWRNTSDPYAIWVSEVMLQQTQVNTVIPYYERFMERFESIFLLAAATDRQVLKAWEGLGYYARIRHLHQAAKTVVTHHNGEIPSRWDAFHALPGVGDYIAAAVLSIAYDRPYAVVDGNVKRVLSRLVCMDLPVNKQTGHKTYQYLADELLDRKRPGNHNQALMELGALICTPRNPLCGICVLAPFCRALKTGSVDQFPKRIKKAPSPQYDIAVGVVVKNGRLLITQRKAEGLLGGLWEFPGGKIGRRESPAQACLREIKEETGLDVHIKHHLTQVRHAYTHFKIVMDVFICTYGSGKVRLNGPVSHRWVTPQAINDFPLPKANHKFLNLLLKTI